VREQVGPGTTVESGRRDVVVLLEAGEGRLVAASEAERPIAEDALGVDHVADDLPHAPFPRRVAGQRRLGGHAAQEAERLVDLVPESVQEVRRLHELHVAVVVGRVLRRVRPSLLRHRILSGMTPAPSPSYNRRSGEGRARCVGRRRARRCSTPASRPTMKPGAAGGIVTTPSVTDHRNAFARLHESGCFVIPNPWDVGSARYLRHLGFKALATTSSGFAFTRGLPDEGAVTRDRMLGQGGEVAAAADLPVNADFQSGYASDPRGVEESVRLCVAAGVSGLSIEDSTGDPTRPLFELPVALDRVRAALRA